MKTYPYHLVNVFAETHFGGNPLAVFPHADGLDDDQMQAISRQFNLSETVFLRAPTCRHGVAAAADLRIFTPSYELPMAGHPTLGAAFVLACNTTDATTFYLNTQAKAVAIHRHDQQVTLRLAKFSQRTCLATPRELADMTGLQPDDIAAQALWLDTGTCQLLLAARSKTALYRAKIDKNRLAQICQAAGELTKLCLWYEDNDQIFVRFFTLQNNALLQDSGTGSACANLGAYLILQGQYPSQKRIHQGDDIGRPNRLSLMIDTQQNIYVGGHVIEVGRGEFYVP